MLQGLKLLLLLLLFFFAVAAVDGQQQQLLTDSGPTAEEQPQQATADGQQLPPPTEADYLAAPTTAAPSPQQQQQATADGGTRFVFTLSTYDACERWEAVISQQPPCATMAKCYGRRLVLNMDQCGFTTAATQENTVLQQASDMVKAWMPSAEVVAVEEDHLFSALDLKKKGGSKKRRSSSRRQEQQDQATTAETVVEGQTIVPPSDTVVVQGQIENTTDNSSGIALSGYNQYQWNLQMIGAYSTWETLGTYGERSTVAVLDSGIAASALPAYLDSERKGSRILDGYDFVSDESLSKDGDGRDPDYFDPGSYCIPVHTQT